MVLGLFGLFLTGIVAIGLVGFSTYRTGRQRGRNVAFSLVIGQTGFLIWAALFASAFRGGSPDPAAAGAVAVIGLLAIVSGIAGLIVPFVLLELVGYAVERTRGSELAEEDFPGVWIPFCAAALTIWSSWATWYVGFGWLPFLLPTMLAALVLAVQHHRRRPSVGRKLLVPLTLIPVAVAALVWAKLTWKESRTETHRAEVIFTEPRANRSWIIPRPSDELVPVVWLDYVDCRREHVIMPLRPDAPEGSFLGCVSQLEVGEEIDVRVSVVTRPLDPDVPLQLEGIEAVGSCEVEGGLARFEREEFLYMTYPDCLGP